MKSEQLFTKDISEETECLRSKKLAKVRDLLSSKNVLMLNGSPGSGKTVLASQIVEKFFSSYIWVTISEEDLDPVSLCTHIYKSIKKKFTRYSVPEFEEKLNNNSLVAIHYETYIKDIIRGFRKDIKKPVAIVLDGVEMLPTIGLACKAVRTALGHSSKHLYFIVTSRRTCNISTFTNKDKARINLFLHDFIDMDAEEYKSCALNYLVDITDFRGLDTIYEMTEGWITGTISAFKILEETGKIPSLSQMAEDLDEYFQSVNSIEADKKETATMYLLSLLDEIDLEFAIMQNGNARIANHLIFMLDNNHFIHKPYATVFRLRKIYKEWVKQLCYKKLSKNEIELFLNNAADYYINKNNLKSALSCLINAKTYSKIETLIRDNIDSIIISEDNSEISRLLSEIPENVMNSSRWMALAYALSINSISPDKAGFLYQNTEKILDPEKDINACAICWGGLAEFYTYIKGDIKRGQEYQSKTHDLIKDESPFSKEVLLYSYSILFSVSIFTCDLTTIKHFMEKSAKANAEINSHRYKIKHTYFTAYYHMLSFSYKSVADCVDQIIKSPGAGNFFSFIIYMLYVHSGSKYPAEYISAKLREKYKDILELFAFHKIYLDIYDAQYAIQAGDIATARKHLESKKFSSSLDIPDFPSALLLAFNGIINALEFDENAIDKGELALEKAKTAGISDYFISPFYLFSGVIHTLLGSFKTAEKRLLQALELSAESGQDLVSASANAYLSYLHMNIGDKENACDFAVCSLRFLKKMNRHNFFCSIKSVVENLFYYGRGSKATADFAEKTAFKYYNIAFSNDGEIIPVLQINAFGEMQIMLGEHRMSSEEFSGNFRMMIAILLSSKDYSSHQEIIQSYLWPTSDKDKARKSFDNLMSRFRKLLSDNFYGINPKDYITISNGIVRLANTKCNADEMINLCTEAWTNYEKGEYSMTLKNALEAKDLYQDKYFPFINDIEKVDSKREYTDRAFLDLLLLIKKMNVFLPDIIHLDGYLAKWLDIYIHETEMVQLAYSYYKEKGDILKCKSILNKFNTYLESEGYTQDEKDELFYMIKASD